MQCNFSLVGYFCIIDLMPVNSTLVLGVLGCLCVFACVWMLGYPCVSHLSSRLAGWKAKTHCPLFPSPPCRTESSQSACPPYKLQLEECLSAEQVPTPELIQGYVKKVGQGVLSTFCPAGRREEGEVNTGTNGGGCHILNQRPFVAIEQYVKNCSEYQNIKPAH